MFKDKNIERAMNDALIDTLQKQREQRVNELIKNDAVIKVCDAKIATLKRQQSKLAQQEKAKEANRSAPTM